MANEEHLAILRQGVEVWNDWRRENPEVRPDLFGADLNETDLIEANLREVNLYRAYLGGADLSRATLSGAKLLGANLSRANLSRTDLYGVDLSEANLYRANLSGANLNGANLSGSDLSRANLLGANLLGANLNETDFSEVEIGSTTFGETNLYVAKGLETVRHRGPSEIGVHTLYQSKGKIPLPFLRGCGLPDTFIEYIPSLTQQPIQFYSCFISYSSHDQAFAERLHADLQNKGVRCWFAPEDMKIGDKIRPTIDQSIRVHDKLLLVLSEHSMASQWVEHEVENALDLEMERGEPVLFPMRLDRAVMDSKVGWAAKIRRERHIGNFELWKDHDSYQKAFERLLRDLKAKE